MTTSHDHRTNLAWTLILGFIWQASACIAGVPPSIARTGQPAHQWTGLGASTEFVVTASGDEPLSYQWRHEKSPIPLQTKARLTLSHVQMSDAGGYDAVIKNNFGSITSAVAQLWVDPLFIQVVHGPHVEDLGVSGYGGCGDMDGDGFLDLSVNRYVFGGPTIYRNNGDGTFAVISNPLPTMADNPWFGFWGDWDCDGKSDLLLGYDQVTAIGFGNGHAAFETLPVKGLGGDWWGCASADFDRDGLVDLYVTAFNGTSRLYRNLGNTEFAAVDGATTIVGTHNHAAWIDYDNDGFLDLYVAAYMDGNKLFRNNGNETLSSVTSSMIPYITAPSEAGTYKGIWFDAENDGFLDLYLLNGDDYASIQTANQFFHNQGNGNAWLAVNLVGTASNRQGVGAQIRLLAKYSGQSRWQRRDLNGGDLNNGNQTRAHFGLGDADLIQALRIDWPSGIVQELYDIEPNQMLTITEPPRLITQEPGSLQITSWPDQSFAVQKSTDLHNWSTLSTVTNHSGTVAFEDTQTTTHSSQYYRAAAE